VNYNLKVHHVMQTYIKRQLKAKKNLKDIQTDLVDEIKRKEERAMARLQNAKQRLKSPPVKVVKPDPVVEAKRYYSDDEDAPCPKKQVVQAPVLPDDYQQQMRQLNKKDQRQNMQRIKLTDQAYKHRLIQSLSQKQVRRASRGNYS
jgi:hypothetical protein